MRLQDTQANCGPASLSNALAAIGIARSQDECAVLCKTTGTDGTPPRNLVAAIKALGRQPVVINERRADVAALWLDVWLRDGRSALLCVDDGTHWVAAIGLCGQRILIADPADNELVLSLSRGELSARWNRFDKWYGVVL